MSIVTGQSIVVAPPDILELYRELEDAAREVVLGGTAKMRVRRMMRLNLALMSIDKAMGVQIGEED